MRPESPLASTSRTIELFMCFRFQFTEIIHLIFCWSWYSWVMQVGIHGCHALLVRHSESLLLSEGKAGLGPEEKSERPCLCSLAGALPYKSGAPVEAGTSGGGFGAQP